MNLPPDQPARSHAACAVAGGVRANATATWIPTVTLFVARSAAALTRYGSRRSSVTHTPDAPAASASAAKRSASAIVVFAGSPTPGRIARHGRGSERPRPFGRGLREGRWG